MEERKEQESPQASQWLSGRARRVWMLLPFCEGSPLLSRRGIIIAAPATTTLSRTINQETTADADRRFQSSDGNLFGEAVRNIENVIRFHGDVFGSVLFDLLDMHRDCFAFAGLRIYPINYGIIRLCEAAQTMRQSNGLQHCGRFSMTLDSVAARLGDAAAEHINNTGLGNLDDIAAEYLNVERGIPGVEKIL